MNLSIKSIGLILLSVWFSLSLNDSYASSRNTKCEIVEMDTDHPIITRQYQASSIRKAISKLEDQGYSNTQAKGKLGERVSQDVLESLPLNNARLISIETILRQSGCSRISKILRSGDRGIDDIFVALTPHRYIDLSQCPIFHEAKYDGRCAKKLSRTKHQCGQLARQWLKANLRQLSDRLDRKLRLYRRLEARGIDNSELREEFLCFRGLYRNIRWIRSQFQQGNFIRTASVLCASGKFSLYEVVPKRAHT